MRLFSAVGDLDLYLRFVIMILFESPSSFPISVSML